MSNVLVMHRNFISDDLLNGFTYSSQLSSTAGAAANIYDRIRRTKLWRSKGYFNITSSNNKIIFRETTGVDLTATITADEYTSVSDFMTAIKTALEAAGASTYTVVQDTTTLKIKITSDGLGGGGIFQLRWADALSTAYDVVGFAASNLTGSLTYTADSLRIHTEEFVRFDLGTATNIQAFAMIGKRIDGLNISPSATVKLQGNTTDVWTSPQYESTLVWNADCMAVIDSDGLESGGLRYWRVHIVDRDNPDGYIEIASMYLGEVITTEGCPQFPLDIDRVDYSRTDKSEWGQKFADIRQITRTIRAQWSFLTIADKENLEEVVELYKTTSPFWMAFDPNEVFSSDFQLMVFQCYFDDLPSFKLTKPGQYDSNWNLVEAV